MRHHIASPLFIAVDAMITAVVCAEETSTLWERACSRKRPIS
ncbi:hypothetical protein [Pseudomonas fluorescens]|nr:hypothetical protein [Pseudomonas fluorescens]